jgi:uncharacterized protein (TIGR03382 family)
MIKRSKGTPRASALKSRCSTFRRSTGCNCGLTLIVPAFALAKVFLGRRQSRAAGVGDLVRDLARAQGMAFDESHAFQHVVIIAIGTGAHDQHAPVIVEFAEKPELGWWWRCRRIEPSAGARVMPILSSGLVTQTQDR